jgi:hypothetical protein
MPDQLFESKAAQVVLQSYLKAKEMEEKSRKVKAGERLAIYHDDWESILEDILRSQFHPDNYKKIRLLKNTSQNILRKVVDDVSVVYKVAPARDYGDNTVMDEIYGYLDIDEFMRQVNQYGWLCKDLLIRAGWDADLERVTLEINTPANTSIIQRDNYPQQAAAVYYEIEYIDDQFKVEKRYIFWSDFEHFVFTEKEISKGGGVTFLAEAPAEDNPDMENPYGKLPFVVLHMKPLPGMFWNTSSGSDLIQSTTTTGFKRTMIDYLFKHASFKQPVITADDADKIPKDLLMDPLTAWGLTGNATATLLDFQAAFDVLDRKIQSDINSTLATYGLSVDMFTVSPNEASGKALQVKNRGLQEIREAQLPTFRRVERELFELIRLVYNTYNAVKIPETLEFKIDFAELETYQDPMDERKQALDDVKNGIISPGQYYMQFNPDITDEVEAEKAMTANLLKYKNMKNQGFSFDQFISQGQDPTDKNAMADLMDRKQRPDNAK